MSQLQPRSLLCSPSLTGTAGPRRRTWAGSHSPGLWGEGSLRPGVRAGQRQAARSLQKPGVWDSKDRGALRTRRLRGEGGRGQGRKETWRVSAASAGTKPGQGGAWLVCLVGEPFCQDPAPPPVRPRPGTSHPYSPGSRPGSVKEVPIVRTGGARAGLNGQKRMRKAFLVVATAGGRNRASEKDPDHPHFLRLPVLEK